MIKGVYLLIIRIENDTEIVIGSLGKILFRKGVYAYVGSGQNNLLKRIERHYSSSKKKHWHIDYSLMHDYSRIVGFYYKKAGKEEECRSAGILEEYFNGFKGFGCSDCKCFSHLFILH